MKIVVCIKHVPLTPSEASFKAGRLERGLDDELNEIDENALEAALSLVEEFGGSVTALTMGPQGAKDALVRAAQMGVDETILITDPDLEGSDVVATALVLGAAIERLGQDEAVDLILMGMVSLDAMTGLLAPALAARLALPVLAGAQKFECDGKQVRIERQDSNALVALKAQLPAVVSVSDQINEPRYPNFAAIAAAKDKPIVEWNLSDLQMPASDLHCVGMKNSGFEIVETATSEAREPVIMPLGEESIEILAKLLKGGEGL